MKHDTAGDPMTGVKWTRRTTDKIACELKSLGVNVSSKTVGRLLKQLGFSLRVNHKKLCGATSEDRDTQFACIAELRERFAAAGHPIISVDTKKRELVGLFKNGGQAWNREPTLVKDHDFRSESNGIAIPYGVYDLLANRGTVFIGTSYNTPDFAVNAIEKWWRTEDGNAILRPVTSRYWQTPGAAMDIGVGVGSTGFKRGFAIATASLSPSPTIPPVPPSGIQWSTACSARSARTGRAGLSTATKPSSNTSGRPPPLPVCEYAHTLSGVAIRRGSKSVTSRCNSYPSQSTRPYPNGTTPYDPLEKGKLFCRGP